MAHKQLLFRSEARGTDSASVFKLMTYGSLNRSDVLIQLVVCA